MAAVKAKRMAVTAAAGAVFAVSLMLSVRFFRKSPYTLVEIVQDGTVIRTVDLSAAPDETIRIERRDGQSYNLVRIENGEIFVQEAGCPDQTCVHMGKLHSDALPIICVPNRLIIRFAEEDGT